MILSDLTRTNVEREAPKRDENDHEYEPLDQYSQHYEDIKTTPPMVDQPQTSSSGDYAFTQCPAYSPVTHGNQQAETSQTETGANNSEGPAAGLYESVSPN